MPGMSAERLEEIEMAWDDRREIRWSHFEELLAEVKRLREESMRLRNALVWFPDETASYTPLSEEEFSTIARWEG